MDFPEIAFAGAAFDRWDELYALIGESFAYMDGRIDPPSSFTRMDAAGLAEKAQSERLLIAEQDGVLVGAVFIADMGNHAYIGKLAVAHSYRRKGLVRRMFALIEAEARASGAHHLELQTRIELTENHGTFAALGFVKTSESAHAGYDRPTSITMRKMLG